MNQVIVFRFCVKDRIYSCRSFLRIVNYIGIFLPLWRFNPHNFSFMIKKTHNIQQLSMHRQYCKENPFPFSLYSSLSLSFRIIHFPIPLCLFLYSKNGKKMSFNLRTFLSILFCVCSHVNRKVFYGEKPTHQGTLVLALWDREKPTH